MKRPMPQAAFLAGALFLLAAPILPAATVGSLTIDHPGAKCIVADRFPHIGAHVSPSEDTARVRAYFKAAETPSWYFVEMRREGDSFSGTLPKPKKSARQINYYIEAIGTSQAESRTSEFNPMVVGPGECGQGDVALQTEPSGKDYKVPVGSTSPNMPLVPTGFNDTGVVQFTAQSETGSKGKDVKKDEKKDKADKKAGEMKKKG